MRFDGVELALDSRALQGEGAFWDVHSGRLLWVDIVSRAVHSWIPETGESTTLECPGPVTTVVPTTRGRLLVAGSFGLAFLSDDGSFEPIANPEEAVESNRMNDGKCDRFGRFWVGSVSMARTEGAASLYRVDEHLEPTKAMGGLTISNGLAWSLDDRLFYHIDTPTLKVRSYRYDADEGAIGEQVGEIAYGEGLGRPDGMTIDAEGNLWIASFAGGCVLCWNPRTAELLRRVKIPCLHVTSCAFGGRNLDTLYVTTARIRTEESVLEKNLHSGGVFAITDAGEGLPLPIFREWE